MKASNVIAPAKQPKQAPDLEEAFEEEDDGEVLIEPKEEEDELDLKKDKFIKVPKAKKAAAKPAAKTAASKKKVAKNEDDEEDDSEEDVKPKKKAKVAPKKAAAAKGKGKK